MNLALNNNPIVPQFKKTIPADPTLTSPQVTHNISKIRFEQRKNWTNKHRNISDATGYIEITEHPEFIKDIISISRMDDTAQSIR